ncbi:HEAT repeat [Singulisphaera sp. GP187]|uniref:HEAT repeat domain-containing protein n=1 Tax=Singulisphaera sp. GP187 TaxID=1882752 RepID=UPI00092626AA|nr:HEAT repeat domain-containing protein [Singulisphaera sp. GP187]SIO05858.1 HEAT repeat [Singulisphaera sp. GP187]
MIPVGRRPSEPAAAELKRPRRQLTGMRALITLVACCGLILWAARVVWEYRDPTLAEDKAVQARALRALGSRKATERVDAIQVLARLHFADSASAIRPLTPMLGDEDSAVRAAAVEALGPIGSRAVQVGLDPDAVRAAVSALIRVLKDPDPGLRRAAVATLGTMSSTKPETSAGPQVGPPPTLPGGKTMGPASALPTPVDRVAVIAAFTEALGDREAAVRGEAIVALASACSAGDPPESLAAGLGDESAENRKATVRALARFRRGLDPWIPRLLRIAEHDDDRSVRAATVGVLGGLTGPPGATAAAVPTLIEALGSRDPRVRAAVAEGLYRFGPEAAAAIPALLRVFTEPIDGAGGRAGAGSANDSRALSGVAAAALGKIAPGSASAKGVVTALTEVVRSGQGARQAQAAAALAQFGPAAAPAIPALVRMAREAGPTHAPESENEQAAAWALGKIAPGTPAVDEAVAALEDVLRSRQAPSRVAAVEALGRLGPNAATCLPMLRALREDPDAEVRRAVKHALAVLVLGDEGKL